MKIVWCGNRRGSRITSYPYPALGIEMPDGRLYRLARQGDMALYTPRDADCRPALEVAPVPDEFRGGPRSSDTFFRIGEDWYRVIRDPGTGAVYGVEPCGEPARPRTYWVARAVDPAAPLSERIGIEISDPADAPAGYAVEGPHETYRTRRTMATKYWQAQLRRGCNVIDMDFPRRETADEAIEDARERLSSLSDRERAGCTASAVEWNWFDCDCMTTGRFVDIDDTL